MKITRHLTVSCLLLFALAGSAIAQSNDPRYVIKRTVGGDDHYLAHVKIEVVEHNPDTTYSYWVLRDVDEFHPDSCLWHSGPNVEHNYYFIDHLGKYRYLTAPLALNGTLSLSPHPGAALNNTTDNYYFYDWDHGIARGLQHQVSSMTDCDPNYHVPSTIEQCWEVVWLTYQSGWKMSSQYSYNPDPTYITNPAPYRHVTVTSHGEEISGESGGITNLVIPDYTMATVGQSVSPDGTATAYNYTITPAYTFYGFEAVSNLFFNIEQESHYFYGGTDNPAAPTSTPYTNIPVASTGGYAWTITGEGAAYLSFTNSSSNPTYSSDLAAPTLYYVIQNSSTSHKTATLTLTVTYDNGATQTRSATVTVMTQCQNPQQASAPVVTYEGVTVSWLGTAQQYKVYWKKSDPAVTDWNSDEVDNVTSYTITTGLDYGTEYDYKVSAYCSGVYQDVPPELVYSFTTKTQPHGLVYGAVFGGGRMANVGGKTEVVIINCDSISAVYGGNDIAGEVLGEEGSTIVLGVAASSETTSYSYLYNGGEASSKVRVFDVYGGGNGYYAYDGNSFVPATSSTTTASVANHANVTDVNGNTVWTNETGAAVTLTLPTIFKTAIEMAANDHVKVDSIFGGAKNAFITNNNADANGTSIIVKGGTAFAVFGGNNFGGTQGYGKHHIEVQGTKTNTNTSATTGYGRNFGIGYLFGGGNKVYGSTTEILITGGQCDTVFAGGNSANVYAANVTVNCLGPDKTITSAPVTWDGDNITEIGNYSWDGTGVYNVRTLFGGNNQATMTAVPSITLTAGCVGTVYGGGNAGDMDGQSTGSITFPDLPATEIDSYSFTYSTYVLMNSPSILVDYLYGGCQMSNVGYSTWVQLQGGHVGTVYGGCNISGDVGSTRVHLEATQFYPPTSTNPNPEYQVVYGATYVEASGGTVYKDLFAGSNGYYHCKDSYGIAYIEGINYAPGHNYVGMDVPTHNETHAIIRGTVLVKGNVYAGGNLACVGFDQKYVNHTPYSYPSLVGLASVRMGGGTVDGNVFGGGNMASIYGSNEVRVWGGSIGMANDGALYGGNDRSGKAGQISNRVLPTFYNTASDGNTSLQNPKVCTYVGVSGNPTVKTVYGGGNGLYAYFTNFNDANAYTGPLVPVVTCIEGDYPIQKDIFVDIAIEGGEDGGYVENVYGGGNGVSVEGFIKVFLNVQNVGNDTRNHIGTVFGGNNEGELYTTLPDIILLHGNVGTIYGGCNKGAMSGNLSFGTYRNLSSLVNLRAAYTAGGVTVETTGKVTQAVYGGCRMNGVTHNTLVLVEGGDHSAASIFGGCDISGNVADTAQVIVTGGTVGTVFGGGNGNYTYTSGPYTGLSAPHCDSTYVEMRGGSCAGNVYGGGYAGECGDTYLLVDGCAIGGSIYGGGNRAGVIIDATTYSNGSTTIEMTDGSVATGIYGGCNETGDIEGDVVINITGGLIGVDYDNKANIHGGGYGEPTTVAGNVDIQFGEVAFDGTSGEEIHNEYPKLFGDLYGGSALGNVNTNSASPNTVSNTTTIHIDNGTVLGNVYGGGLGFKDENDPTNDVEAMVYGVVHVYVGGPGTGAGFTGKASFVDPDNNYYGSAIFGCNNINGSPQDLAYVHVYQTNHTDKDVYTYNSADDRKYAIYQVFGGGNRANYAPENNSQTSTKKTYVQIYDCENTVEEVFGGSNAAHSISASTIVEGGRFNYIFGGGNGMYGEANVGVNPEYHSTYSQIQGGHVGWCFGGSNRLGSCVNIVQDLESGGSCGELVIDYLFQGGNQADQYGELELNFTCERDERYIAAYGGCRLGTVYGNITINMTGGRIGTLYGGCQGSPGWRADVKRCPTLQEIEDHPDDYTQELKNFLAAQYALGNNWYGKGGNITVIVKGGAIGNLYGGCENNGNVDGKITIVVESEDNTCDIFVGNIYGASHHTDYIPEDPNGISPRVNVIKAVVGGEHEFNDQPGFQENERFAGNVYGGGNIGIVTSNPKVNIGDGTTDKAVTITGSVFGGGNEGNVIGSPQVVVVPDTRTLTVNPPQVSGTPPTQGGGTVVAGVVSCDPTSTTNVTVGEDVDISITGIPTAATGSGDGPGTGYLFKEWTVTGTGASVGNPKNANTTFNIGTATTATLQATFKQVPAHKLTLASDGAGSGTFKVNGVNYTEPIWIAEGATVTVEVIPTPGTNSVFKRWTLSGANSSISSGDSAFTTFTMGTENATLTATIDRTDGRNNNRNNQR